MTTDTTDTTAALAILTDAPTTETLLAALTDLVSEYADEVHTSHLRPSKRDGAPLGTISIGDYHLDFEIRDGTLIMVGTSNEYGSELFARAVTTDSPQVLAGVLTDAADFVFEGLS